MKNGMGAQSRIGTVVPRLSSIKPIVNLGKPAKIRLSWMDYWEDHDQNAALTCRHFGIARSCFYKWQKRYNRRGLTGLAETSRRPSHVRKPTTPTLIVDRVRRLRRANPELSKYKLAVLLDKEYGHHLSASSVGRIITRYQLFFIAPIKPKGHPNRRHSIVRNRKPKGFVAARPGDLIEFDVKHLPNMGVKRYGFVAIDVVTKQAAIHVASTISATQGVVAWEKTVRQLGMPRAVMNDNGSENLGAFAELLKDQNLPQYFARPRTPKDKPHVERFIGTLERECLQWGGVAQDLADQQAMIDDWLVKYHSYRPHQALGYLTPDEYKAKLEAAVSSM